MLHIFYCNVFRFLAFCIPAAQKKTIDTAAAAVVRRCNFFRVNQDYLHSEALADTLDHPYPCPLFFRQPECYLSTASYGTLVFYLGEVNVFTMMFISC